MGGRPEAGHALRLSGTGCSFGWARRAVGTTTLTSREGSPRRGERGGFLRSSELPLRSRQWEHTWPSVCGVSAVSSPGHLLRSGIAGPGSYPMPHSLSDDGTVPQKGGPFAVPQPLEKVPRSPSPCQPCPACLSDIGSPSAWEVGACAKPASHNQAMAQQFMWQLVVQDSAQIMSRG